MTAVERFRSFVESGLPEADVLAWMEKLTDEQRQEIQAHAIEMSKMAEAVLRLFGEVFGEIKQGEEA